MCRYRIVHLYTSFLFELYAKFLYIKILYIKYIHIVVLCQVKKGKTSVLPSKNCFAILVGVTLFYSIFIYNKNNHLKTIFFILFLLIPSSYLIFSGHFELFLNLLSLNRIPSHFASIISSFLLPFEKSLFITLQS